MNLHKDLREFVELLSANEVRYLVVGAFAVAHYGYPRYTSDIDLFVDRSTENAERVLSTLRGFGFEDLDISIDDLVADDRVIQLGVAPNRLDIMTSISGVQFDEAWDSREEGQIDGICVYFISRELLRRNKTATGRAQDLADLDRL